MAYFELLYKHKGERKKVILEAQTRAEALSLFKSHYNVPALKIREVNPPLSTYLQKATRAIQEMGRNRKVDPLKLAISIRQIAVMVNAGLNFSIILAETIDASEDPMLKEIFQRALEEINAGLSFSESLKRFDRQVGRLTISMVELGERTGNMAQALSSLADMLTEIHNNRQKLKKALRYPMLVLLAIAIAFIVILLYVVPKFKAIFSRFGSELPLPTKILIAVEEGLRHYGLFILVGTLVIAFAVGYFYHHRQDFRLYVDRNLLKLYLIGKVIRLSQIARFNLSLSELMRAGLPVAEALKTATGTLDNRYLYEKFQEIGIAIGRGSSLTDAMRETRIFEGMTLQMVNAGESSGTLDDMLTKAAEYYKERFRYLIDNISAYLEPILIAILALFVTLLALGIFMPMWDLSSAVHKH